MSSDEELDPLIQGLAVRNECAVVKARLSIPQTKAADRLGLAKSTLNAWETAHIQRAMRTLAAYDLVVVDRATAERMIPADQLAAYMTLASAHMEAQLRGRS